MVKLIYIHTLRLSQCCWGLPLLCLFWHHHVPHSSHGPSQCLIQHFLNLQLKRSKPVPPHLHHATPHHPQQPLAMHPAITTLGCCPCVSAKCLKHGAFEVALQTYLLWRAFEMYRKKNGVCTMNRESVRPLFSFVALNSWQSSWSMGWDLVCFLNHINKVCQLDAGGHLQQRLRELGAQIPLT